MWIHHPFFKYMTGTILVLICVFLLVKLHLFVPVKTVIGALFFPVLIAGFLYFITKPFVRFLSRMKYLNDVTAIVILYAIVTGIVYGGYKLLAQTITDQVSKISTKLPEKLKETTEQAGQAIEKNDLGMVSTSRLTQKITGLLGDLAKEMGNHLTEIASALTSATTVLIVVPFVLFYFLKDDNRFSPFLLAFVPKKHRQEGEELLYRIRQTLAAYIIGQVIVATVDGILMFIGYLIIGLDYALILALFVIVTAVVPFFGPMIGVLPALVVALTVDPLTMFYVLLTLVIVQQLEGNLVAPLVLGNKLEVHPLTIIFLLIIAAALYGFIGMLIAIPVYSVLKVIVKHVYSFYYRKNYTQTG
ncbi:AI-2E family transporter [Sediminibacillus massiliensis]|uniref:AI-2E family transporter n=1 Tax=Sediminibacillus massiliensis TaxID=1926277 RepID=UPI0009886D5B|nr:AI-2E family transporter [Sediminibacillus massiliensis]